MVEAIRLGKPLSTFDEDRHDHIFTSPKREPMARMVFDYIEDEGAGKLFCEATIWWLLGDVGSDPIVGPVRVNLLNDKGQGWGGLAQTLERRVADVDWFGALQTAVSSSVLTYRALSSEGSFLAPADPADAADPFLLKPWVSSSGITLLYAPGGAGKSTIALAIAVSVGTGVPIFGSTPSTIGKVIYVDFEDDPYPHQLRLSAIAKAIGYDDSNLSEIIHHERITGALRDARRRIRTLVREMEAALVVVDSVGLARAGDVSASDTTIKLFKSLRYLGVPVLAIDHVTKEDMKLIERGKAQANTIHAIGSQFTMSSARLAWFLMKMPSSNETTKRYNAHNTKHNHVKQQASRGLVMTISSNELGLPTDIQFGVMDELFFLPAEEESAALMILKAIGRNQAPMTTTQLSKAVGKNKSTVSMALTHNPDWFEKGQKVGKEQFYRLTDGAKQFVETEDGSE